MGTQQVNNKDLQDQLSEIFERCANIRIDTRRLQKGGESVNDVADHCSCLTAESITQIFRKTFSDQVVVPRHVFDTWTHKSDMNPMMVLNAYVVLRRITDSAKLFIESEVPTPPALPNVPKDRSKVTEEARLAMIKDYNDKKEEYDTKQKAFKKDLDLWGSSIIYSIPSDQLVILDYVQSHPEPFALPARNVPGFHETDRVKECKEKFMEMGGAPTHAKTEYMCATGNCKAKVTTNCTNCGAGFCGPACYEKDMDHAAVCPLVVHKERKRGKKGRGRL